MGVIGAVKDFVARSAAWVAVAETGGGERFRADSYGQPGEDSQPLPGDYVALMRTPRTGVFAAVAYLDPNNEKTAKPGERRLYSRDESGAVKATVWLKNTGEIEATTEAGASVVIAETGAITADTGAGSSVELSETGAATVKGGPGTANLALDGTISLTSGAGSIVMAPGGIVTINGATFAPGGIVAVSSLAAGALTGAGGGPAVATSMEVSTSLKAGGVEMVGHGHPAGTLLDAEGRPITGATGPA